MSGMSRDMAFELTGASVGMDFTNSDDMPKAGPSIGLISPARAAFSKAS